MDLRGWILLQEGYHVINCSNGFEAIRRAVTGRVHVVVIDLDRNAVEMTVIAREIKRRRPSVPTIVLTERSGREHRSAELCRMADLLVPKEHGPEALVEGVEKALDQKATAA